MPYIQHTKLGSVMKVDDARMWCEPHMGYKVIGTAEGKRLMHAEAVARLRELLKPGDTVWTIVKSASRSGMSRVIDCYVIVDNVPQSIAHYAARALDWGYTNDRERGVKVSGCGMDMGFHLVDSLGRAIGYNVEDRGLGDLKQRWL